MRRSNVPVSMGSPSFRTLEAGGFLVSEVWFAPGSAIPRHTHERAVLGVMLEGGFDDRFSARTLELTAGQLFTEPGEEAHSNHVGPAGAHVLALQPDPADEHLTSTCRTLLDEIRSMRHTGVADSAWRLSVELHRPDHLSTLAIESLALDMVVGAIRHRGGHGEPEWLDRVDQIVRDTFREPLSMAAIAREVGVHRAHLARVYRAHRGLPVATHIRRLRLAWAAERLHRSSDSISSIAIQAGFADQSHLTRAFKRRFGVPPGAYRGLDRAIEQESPSLG